MQYIVLNGITSRTKNMTNFNYHFIHKLFPAFASPKNELRQLSQYFDTLRVERPGLDPRHEAENIFFFRGATPALGPSSLLSNW
jgi:hypothetical protein